MFVSGRWHSSIVYVAYKDKVFILCNELLFCVWIAGTDGPLQPPFAVIKSSQQRSMDN